MLIDDLNNNINIWINALQHYNFDQLCARPSATSWSLGQVYMHLVEDARFYIEQMKTCLLTNDNATEESSAIAKKMVFQ